MTNPSDEGDRQATDASGHREILAGAGLFEEAQRLFERACELPRAQRADFLAAHAGSHEIAGIVAGLLRSDDEQANVATDPFRAIAPEFAADAIGLLEGDLHAGERVGAYEIVRLLGEGGFGVVYLGIRREPIEQLAAIKVIKPGMDTRETLRRFSTERRALALMSHPCIARVYDAGATPSGRPYVIMEYVDGMPITLFAREKGLSIKHRIELMIDVCEAVQHAHSKGVIHRDLKPTNILVVDAATGASLDAPRTGTRCSRPIPKIIDFGIAKVIDEMRRTPITQTGAALPTGTPRYMSPEQREPGRSSVDTRTDVYSLGVTLQELLTGLAPAMAESAEHRNTHSRGGTDADATRPETGLRRVLAGAPESSSTAALYLALPGGLRADLHRIFQCAMNVAPDARYATPIQLADDLRCLLSGHPVRAAGKSWRYRTSKFVRRNLAVCLIALLCTILVVGGAAVAVVAAARESALRRAADLASQAASLASNRSRLTAARALLYGGDGAAAKVNLDLIAAEARGWEWRLLAAHIDPVERVFRGHTKLISSARFSPDGRLMISGSFDGTARLWDVRTGIQIHEWRGDFGSDRVCADFSPDGSMVVVGGHADGLWFFDTQSKKEVRRVPGVPLNNLRYSPDGALVAVAARNGPTRLVDARTGSLVRTLDFPSEELEFSRDGRLLAMTGNNGSPQTNSGALFVVATGECRWTGTLGPERATGVTLSWDAGLVALCGGDRVLVFPTDSSREASVLTGDAIRGVRFAGDDGRLLGGGESGALHAWAPRHSTRPALRFTASLGLVVRDMTPDGQWVLTSSGDHQLRLWRVQDPNRWRPASLHGAEHFMIASNPFDDRIAAFSYRSNRLVLRSVNNQQSERVIDVPIRGLEAVAFSPDPGVMFVAGEGKVARLDLVSARLTDLFPCANSSVSLLVSPDRSTLAASSLGKPTVLMDLSTGRTNPLRARGGSLKLRAVAFAPDSDVLACVDDESFDLVLVHWPTGEVLRAFSGHSDGIVGASISPHGSVMVSGSWDGTLRAWDITTGQTLAIRHGAGHVSAPVFVDNGRRVVACDRGGFLRVWDTQDWEEVCSIRAHPSWAAVRVAADGVTLVTSGHADGFRIWRDSTNGTNSTLGASREGQ